MRLKDENTALQFIQGADSLLDDIRGDCGVTVNDLRQRLSEAERAARRLEYDHVAGITLQISALLSDKLIDCMGPREEIPA